jgi:hypothetical protein
MPNCGETPFQRVVEGFRPTADLLAHAAEGMLYRRGEGRIRSALNLP